LFESTSISSQLIFSISTPWINYFQIIEQFGDGFFFCVQFFLTLALSEAVANVTLTPFLKPHSILVNTLKPLQKLILTIVENFLSVTPWPNPNKN
jgi:hypothetical protein